VKKTALYISAFVIVASVSSCKKETTTNTPQSSTPTIATPSDADGAFIAVSTITEQTVPVVGTQIILIGTAVGGVFSSTGSASYVGAGTVTIDGSTLTKQSNNSYLYTPGTTNPTGIDFDFSTEWTASGPGLSYLHNSSFPTVGSLNSSIDVQTSGSYNISVSSITGADSVLYIISGPNGSVQKTKAGNYTNCSFTSSELSMLGTGDNQGLIQIAPYNWTSTVQGGKKYYFIKEAVLSKLVNLK
jgi:hypothetical protein